MKLEKDRSTEYNLGDLLSGPVAGRTRIFAGSLVCINREGLAVPAADEAGLLFWGVATAQVDNRDGNNGDLSVVVRRRGRYLLDLIHRSAYGWHNLGDAAYAFDDHTVAVGTSHKHVLVGVVSKMSRRCDVWVDIERAVQMPRGGE